MPGEYFEYQTRIRESHLDTFGHVNNAKYLELFEEARWERMTTGGYPLADIQTLGQGPVILEVSVQFRKELKLREKIRVSFQVKEAGAKIGKLEQILYNAEGQVSATAFFKIGFFDLKLRKLIPPTDRWLKAIGWTA